MNGKNGFAREEFLQLLEALALAPGLPGREGARARVLAEYFAARGVTARVDRAGNTWVDAGAAGPWRETVVFDAHLDTVPPGRAEKIARAGDRLVGAGVADNLAQATMLALFAARRRGAARSGRPLALVFSTGEEGLGNLKGMRRMVLDRPEPPRLFIAWESDPERYSFHALGSRRYRLSVRGPGGHSWGNTGVSSAAGELVGLLAGIRAAYRRAAPGLASRTSYNLGTIRGGEGINQIARAAEATFEFRSADPACLALMDTLTRTRPALKKPPRDITASLELIGERPAARAANTGALEATLRKTWRAFGLNPQECVRSTNTNIPLAAGWTCACLGLCRGGNTHRPDEYLELSSLETGWQLLGRFASELAG